MSGNLLSWLIRLATVVALLFLQRLDGLSASAGAVTLILLGVPHGAADHLIFRSRYPGRGTLLRFFVFYGLLVATYAGIWYLWPGLALAVFLLASIYHFGQSYFDPGDRRPAAFRVVRQLAWGSFVLLFPIIYHYDEARPIVERILGRALNVPEVYLSCLPPALVATNLYVIYHGWSHHRLSGQVCRTQILDLLLLVILYTYTGLLPGFAIFFLLWHSLPAVVEQWHYLTQRHLSGNLTSYLWQLLPLSAAAFLTMGVAYWLAMSRGEQPADLALLFILISLITLPHAFLVDRVYR